MPIQTASRRSVAGALLAFLLVVVGFPLATNQIARAQEEVLYLSIVDDEGNPVTDITEDEFVVQWDGQDSEKVELVSVDWQWASAPSKSKQSVELDNEGAIFEAWKARSQRVTLVGIDDEQLAPGLILPSKTNVRPQGIAAGIELH